MRIFLALFALALVPTVSYAETLSFQNGEILADYKWQQGPQVNKESVLELFWHDVSGQPLSPQFRVVLWMPDMGHGSAPTKIVPQELAGNYQVRRMFFTMPGDWDVKIEFLQANGSVETKIFSLSL